MRYKEKRDIHTWTVRLTVVGLVLLCINPGLTQGHANMNVLLNAGLCLSPSVLLIRQTRTWIPRIDIPAGILILCVLLFPLLFHPDTIRLSTMLFTCAYCVYFMMLARLIKAGGIDSGLLLRLIRMVTYAFAVVLIIQQLCVAVGLPVPLEAMRYHNPWKLNSLTAEPSHTTVTLSILLFFYTRTLRYHHQHLTLWVCIKSTPMLWIAYTWVLFTTDNASAFLLGPLCLLPFITRRNIGYVLAAIAAIAVVILSTPAGNIENVKRLKSVTGAIFTLNDSTIMEADLSASARLVPTLRGARLAADVDWDTLTGHGVDSDARDTAPRPCDDQERGSAGIFSVWYNYGAIAAISLWILIGFVTIVRKEWLSLIPFILSVQLMADFNMQLGWMVMAFSMVYKYIVADCRSLLSRRL